MNARFDRGEVYWTDLEPVRGSEMKKIRPCVIVSAAAVNTVRKTVVIIPLTSTTKSASWPLLIEVPSGGPDSKVRVEQIRVIDKSRIRRLVGQLDDEDMKAIEEALALVLQIRH